MAITRTKEASFAEIFQRAIEIAETRLNELDTSENEVLTRAQLEALVKSLRHDRKEVLLGSIESYQGQLFGPMKFVIDWGEPNDSELLKSLHRIEVFYRKNY